MYAGWDFVLYALLLAAVVAWNLFTQALQRRRRQQALERARREEQAAGQTGDAAAPAPWEPSAPQPWGRAPVPDPPAQEPWGREPMPPPPQEPWGRAPAPAQPSGEAWGRDVPAEVEQAGLGWNPPVRPAPLVAQAPRRAAAPDVHARRPPHPRRWRTRAQVRDAVVAMTVLGPCRAMEPWQGPGESVR